MFDLKKIIFFICLSLSFKNGDKKAYQIFNNKNEKVTYYDMLKEISKADIIFFWRTS